MAASLISTMDIADVEDGEAVKRRRQLSRDDAVVLELDLRRIAQAPPIKSGEHQSAADQRMRQRGVFEVKKIQPLAEDLCLVVLLDAEALPRMQAPETFLERAQHVVVVCSHGIQGFVRLSEPAVPPEANAELIAQAPARMAPALSAKSMSRVGLGRKLGLLCRAGAEAANQGVCRGEGHRRLITRLVEQELPAERAVDAVHHELVCSLGHAVEFVGAREA